MQMTISFPTVLLVVDSKTCDISTVEKVWIKQRRASLFLACARDFCRCMTTVFFLRFGWASGVAEAMEDRNIAPGVRQSGEELDDLVV